jgi:hypothetical protein
MALQSKVNVGLAPAIAGMPASVVETHYTAQTYQAASDLTVGNFCFADATAAGTKVNKAGPGILRGIVVYTRQYITGEVTAANAMVIPKGAFAQIATNGKFWVVAQNASAKVGDYVLASQADGSVTTQADNAKREDYTMTNFVVEKVLGTEAKPLVLISNQQPNVVPPMATA